MQNQTIQLFLIVNEILIFILKAKDAQLIEILKLVLCPYQTKMINFHKCANFYIIRLQIEQGQNGFQSTSASCKAIRVTSNTLKWLPKY